MSITAAAGKAPAPNKKPKPKPTPGQGGQEEETEEEKKRKLFRSWMQRGQAKFNINSKDLKNVAKAALKNKEFRSALKEGWQAAKQAAKEGAKAFLRGDQKGMADAVKKGEKAFNKGMDALGKVVNDYNKKQQTSQQQRAKPLQKSTSQSSSPQIKTDSKTKIAAENAVKSASSQGPMAAKKTTSSDAMKPSNKSAPEPEPSQGQQQKSKTAPRPRPPTPGKR